MTPEQFWEPLESSHIEAMSHSPSESALYIKFKGGSVYRYPNVAQEEVDGLRNAASPGRYLHLMLRNRGERLS